MVTLPLLVLAIVRLGHPLHTSVADVRYDPAAGQARIEIRIYADDLAQAVPRGAVAADSSLARYGRERFTMSGPDGAPLPLAWGGAERTADALVLRYETRLPAGLRGTRIGSTVLHERFGDQLNIVRVSDGSQTTTLLFLRGDRPKTVP